MSFFTPPETLLDPISGTAASGVTEQEEIGPCVAWSIKRLATSTGTLRFKCRTKDEGAAADASDGHTLTALDPVFGPVPFDSVHWISVYGESGWVDYEIARSRRTA